jgi:hypothetical protein
VGDGTAVKTLEPPPGPGRPRTVYGPRPGMGRSGTRHHRLLAQILLSQLAADEPDAGPAAVRAGREWGRLPDSGGVTPGVRRARGKLARRLTALTSRYPDRPQDGSSWFMLSATGWSSVQLSTERGVAVRSGGSRGGSRQGSLARLVLVVWVVVRFPSGGLCLGGLGCLGGWFGWWSAGR